VNVKRAEAADGAVIKSFEFDEYGNLLNSSGSGTASCKTGRMKTGRSASWMFAVLLVLVGSFFLNQYINRPIPHPRITGATLIHFDQKGILVEDSVQGLGDKSATTYITTDGQEFDLDGRQPFKVIYPSGEIKTFGQFREADVEK
jgi:hypothetical protein